MKKQVLTQFFRALVLSALVLTLPTLLHAQGSLVRTDYPDSYTVLDGDTLWEIAGQFLQNPERWPEIWRPDPYLDNADLIYPGDILRLRFVGGAPRILVSRGDRTEERLGPRIREEPLASTIPEIPLEAIENSFTRNRIVNQQLYDEAPYIVANLGNNLAIGTGDEVYARGSWPAGTTSFEVYRSGRNYLDESGEVHLGLELEYLGFASITESESPELKRMAINNSSKEIRVGDRLLIREESSIDATIHPTQPVSSIDGQIIAFLGNETMASQLDTVVIDIGQRDNLAIGDILSIQQPGERITDDVESSRMTFRQRFSNMFSRNRLQMPGKEIGTLLVYKTFEQMSYALIINSIEPAELYNQVRSP